MTAKNKNATLTSHQTKGHNMANEITWVLNELAYSEDYYTQKKLLKLLGELCPATYESVTNEVLK